MPADSLEGAFREAAPAVFEPNDGGLKGRLGPWSVLLDWSDSPEGELVYARVIGMAIGEYTHDVDRYLAFAGGWEVLARVRPDIMQPRFGGVIAEITTVVAGLTAPAASRLLREILITAAVYQPVMAQLGLSGPDVSTDPAAALPELGHASAPEIHAEMAFSGFPTVPALCPDNPGQRVLQLGDVTVLLSPQRTRIAGEWAIRVEAVVATDLIPTAELFRRITLSNDEAGLWQMYVYHESAEPGRCVLLLGATLMGHAGIVGPEALIALAGDVLGKQTHMARANYLGGPFGGRLGKSDFCPPARSCFGPVAEAAVDPLITAANQLGPDERPGEVYTRYGQLKAWHTMSGAALGHLAAVALRRSEDAIGRGRRDLANSWFALAIDTAHRWSQRADIPYDGTALRARITTCDERLRNWPT